ncbi:hypothetical protein KIH74_05300 [Kineosporia sp. J2-2]|uniref:Uncharacterized protein n=1 Tax=Kineosporia corallincola TaxID=2835133 RepID=A0ABS5TE06_9ACTN|nr:hypothetical protein [Kineosporia corallincola]MBT0768328.1 hypothetical protein [Kineosporia corallincola]
MRIFGRRGRRWYRRRGRGHDGYGYDGYGSGGAVAGTVVWLVVVALVLAFCWWAFHGTFYAVLRTVWASTMWKVLILGSVGAFGLAVVGSRRRDYGGGDAWALFLVVLLLSPFLGVWGGYHRAQQLSESIEITGGAQPEYEWRTPWVVAANSVVSRAGSVVGTFDEDATTFLPATGAYVTPVRARGWIKGFNQIVVQTPGENTVGTCDFDAQVPVARGWFQYNLRRALSFVGGDLMADPQDVWAYCDGDKGVMVVPVTRYAGFPEQHPVPGGVVLFDGHSAVLHKDVKAGELPGPVYPISLAARQREASHALNGYLDRLFRRSGYETVESADGPDSGNESELLLRRTDGSGWDYVTALTPRGTSKSVVAVATIAADEVHAGDLNRLTVHKLASARQGNVTLSNAIIAAFPQLNWNANQLSLTEVVPTSNDTWTASITKSTTVTRLVEIAGDGSMCLTYLSGEQIACVDAGGGNAGTDNGDGGTGDDGDGEGTSGDLGGLSNEELAQLQRRVADEVARRLSGDAGE